MWKFMLILLIGLSNLPKTTPCVAQYGQCGGLQYTGETDCCAPSTCQYSNAWYSQCIPSATQSTTGCSALYSQCGGQNWSGPTCCTGSTCTYSNPYYSQCLPPASSSSSSSSTTTANSPSSTTTNTPTTTQGSSSTSSSTTSTSTSASSANQGCGALYGQCGGIGWNGPTCCTGSTCTYSNPYYSQCLLPASSSSSSSSTTTANSPSSTTTNTPTTTQGSSSTSSSTTSTSTSASSANQGCGALYGQCGGIGWNGPTCCTGSTCTYSNPYYSQCLLPASSSSSSSSTTTANSPSSTTTNTPTSGQGSSSTSSSTTTTSTSASSTNQGCSALYGQCGGIGWNGPTCCTGSTCTFGNAYYSQCLPSGGSSSSSSSSSSGGSTVSSITISSGNNNPQQGTTTRYWDCCKPSCGWPGKASVTNPVQTCAQDGFTPVDVNAQSGCNSGSAYMCSNQQPWNVSSTLSYGYAAADISGEGESDWCCACYSLIFTSGPVIGKELIVQVTNTGGDLGSNQFDLEMPGGGVGLFNGCLSQFPGPYVWGQQYGGVSQRSDCANLPSVLQAGCYWRFDWFMNANNPSMTFEPVKCPSVLTDKTGCVRL